MIDWILSKEQLANSRQKILNTLRWMRPLSKAESYDYKVTFEYHSDFKEWWLFITGSGCGATYTIKKNHKCWKLI